MTLEIDILLDENDDIIIVNGDFLLGESLLQEIGIILRLNTGELRSDPVLAPNLVQLFGKKYNPQEYKERVQQHLKRDNKVYEEVKELLTNKVILK